MEQMELKMEERMKQMEELVHELSCEHIKLDEQLKDAREVILALIERDRRKMKRKMSDIIEMDNVKLELETKEKELRKREKKLKLRERRLEVQEALIEAERIELRTEENIKIGERTIGGVYGVKVIGELDRKPFIEAMKRKLPGDDAEEEGTLLWSSCRKYINNPIWYPFKIILDMKGNFKGIQPDEDDLMLSFWRNEYGEEVFNAVTEAMLEINEHTRGRHTVFELWNHKEKRRATRKELVLHLVNLQKGRGDGRSTKQKPGIKSVKIKEERVEENQPVETNRYRYTYVRRRKRSLST